MTRNMFLALKELKSDIVVVDKLLKKTSTTKYLKKDAHAKHIVIANIYHSPASFPVQFHAKAK